MSQLTNSQRLTTLRVLDANYNRSVEGLRVVEEYARFGLDHAPLAGEIKQLRHELVDALKCIPASHLLAAENTPGDVGTEVKVQGEYVRTDLLSLVRANFQRVHQALRALEEYGKLLSPEVGQTIESLRYRSYALEAQLLRTTPRTARLQTSHVYLLVDGGDSAAGFAAAVERYIAVGVDIIQLRDKGLDDRALLQRARQLRELTRGTETLFIVNDRPDIAALSDADGVHVGQEELSVYEVRRIVGPDVLIGVSTHNLQQVRQAVADTADYIGCGPTFPSTTKAFDHFPGLAFLREVAAEVALSAFAIGGITLENVGQVTATGFTRVAVSGVLTSSPDPAAAVAALKRALVAGPPVE